MMERHRILTRPISWYARIKFIETLLSEIPEARAGFEAVLEPYRAELAESGGRKQTRAIVRSRTPLEEWVRLWRMDGIGSGMVSSAQHVAWGEFMLSRERLLEAGKLLAPFLEALRSDKGPRTEPTPDPTPSPSPQIPSFDPTLEPYKKWLKKAEALVRQHGQAEQKRYLEQGYVWVKGSHQDEQAVRLKNVPHHHFRWAVLKWCGGFTLEQIKDIDERREIGSSAETSTMSEAITGVLKLIKAHL